jgi:uncharacterized membrane protein YfcA
LNEILLLSIAIFLVAVLYSSVGHAGASGYIAVMILFGLAPSAVRPAALVLNILVASLAAWQFWSAGHFSWRLFWPFAMLSIPFSFLGGYLSLPAQTFTILIAIVLFISAVHFFVRPTPDADAHPPARPVAFSVGAALGFLSGMTGVGGGIFLTPLLIVMRWARTKNASAVSAVFILVNSIAGLGGNYAGTRQLPMFALPLLVAAAVGGTLGSYFGSRRFSPRVIKKVLALVLFIAGMKLILA